MLESTQPRCGSRSNVQQFDWCCAMKTVINYAYNYNELVSTGPYTEDAISGGTNDSRAVTGAPLTTYFLVRLATSTLKRDVPFTLTSPAKRPLNTTLKTVVRLAMVCLTRRWFEERNHLRQLDVFVSIHGSVWCENLDSSAKRQLGVVTDWNMRTDVFDRWRQPGDASQYPVLTLDETTYSLPSGFLGGTPVCSCTTRATFACETPRCLTGSPCPMATWSSEFRATICSS